MKKEQVLILDCFGKSKPAICFNLEITGYRVRVVTAVDEAVNLLTTAKMTGEHYLAFLINNPCQDGDVGLFMEEVLSASADLPVIFVANDDSFHEMLEILPQEKLRPQVHFTESSEVTALLSELIHCRNSESKLAAGRYGC